MKQKEFIFYLILKVEKEKHKRFLNLVQSKNLNLKFRTGKR
jgi:hypothetical protein